MGLLDFFTSTKRPKAGTPPLSESEVRKRLTEVNRPTAPWRVRELRDEGVDYVVEWRISEPEWAAVLKKAGVTSVFRIFLKLASPDHVVRSSDREFAVTWGMKEDAVGYELTLRASRGQKQEFSFGTPAAFRETDGSGRVHEYRFLANELKAPIQEAVTSCGWTYRGVAFGKL